ncbi:topoisomerase IV [Lactococcus formosensis]|uniref:topoisomerase IV n=1 Tax=Lactococcus formosensis TaxID=1281486 RepID=UPI002435A58B|nr:topoisomerase IV [Lactococcus formosensis]MDG6143955.1 topoisomerase IV [Lactococcus formosensis]MDG6156415.1 topoisomerase IV [Lactococcus formosensis]
MRNSLFLFLIVLLIIIVVITIYRVLKKSISQDGNDSIDDQQNISVLPISTVEDDKPFEISIPVELLPERVLDERKLYEIKDSNVIARITETVPALTNTTAKTVTNKSLQSVGEVYRAIIPSGATLSKSKGMEGAVRGFYSNGKGIAGQANFVKIDPSQLNKASQVANGVANVMNVASLVVGQYYMSEVNDRLETMNKNISEISDFQQREFKSKIFSLIARVGKISKFSFDILENDELRNRKLHSLDAIEGEVTQLLQQVNITIDEISQNNVQLDLKMYSEKMNEFNTLLSYQKVLASLLEEMSKLMYSLNRGAVKAEMCYAMFNGYVTQSNDALSKLEKWHEIQTKYLGIDIDNHRIKKSGIEGVFGEVQGIINNDWKYKPLDDNMEKKIISQTVNKKLEVTPPDEVLNKDIEIVSKDGKLYYLK